MKQSLLFKYLFLVLSVFFLSNTVYATVFFSAVSPSGHTLYYSVENGQAIVTYNIYSYAASGSGNVIIPATVTNPNTGVSYNVTKISSFAFHDRSQLLSVEIPSSIQYIGDKAFDNCTELSVVYFNADSCWQAGTSTYSAFTGCTKLANVIFGDNVKIIPNYVLKDCQSLKTVTIGTSVDSIGVSAFASCDSLKTIYYNADSCYKMQQFGYFPFRNCSYHAKVIIGNNVRYIPKDLFYYFDGLATVVIPSSVYTIGSMAFAEDENIDSVIYEGTLEQWCNIDFQSGKSNPAKYAKHLIIDGVFVRNVNIPSSLSVVKRFIFCGYDSLYSVTIPNSIIEIENEAFSGCSMLSSVIMSDSVWKIGQGAFMRCPSLQAAPISNFVTHIYPDAFLECGGINSVTFPETCEFVGSNAFTGCGWLGRGLSSATFLSEVPPTFGTAVFGNHQGNAPFMLIYVPCKSRNAYCAALGNNPIDVNNIIEPQAELWVTVIPDDNSQGYTEVIPIRGNEISCDSNVIVRATAFNGYRFDHWSKGSTSAQDTFHLMHDDTIIAYFIPIDAIGDIEMSSYNITTDEGQIVVEGADGYAVTLFDINGRMIATKQDYGAEIRFDALASGTYMIKIGSHPARKVVVIR